MAKLSDDKIAKNMETVKQLVGNIVVRAQPAQRDCIETLFKELEDEFYTAPASTREDYHGAFPGGLCDHSLRVVQNLRKIAATLAPNTYTLDRLDFIGLVHDLGKVGDGSKRPLYVPNPNEYGRKRGFIYEINKDLPYMPISDRTIYLLQKYGVTLSDEEWLAIRLSDGQYEEGNRRYGMKEPDLALLLHFADRWACALEKSA